MVPRPQICRAPLREAYCWGKFSYAAATSAAWLLLLPFALVNLASWALPSPYRPPKHPLDVENEDQVKDFKWRWLRRLSRALVRLLGLALTAAFISTTCYLLIDIIARQAVDDGKLPDWYKRIHFEHREAISLSLVLLVVVALRVFSKVTTGKYEAWSPGDELPVQPSDDGDNGKVKRIRLAEPDMWRGSASVRRQQFCHVLIACALILTFAGLTFGTDSWQVRVGAGTAAAMGLFATAVLSTPGCDRTWIVKSHISSRKGTTRRTWALHHRLQTALEGLTWAGTVAVVVYVWFFGPHSQGTGYDFEAKLLHYPVLAEFILLGALSVAVAAQRPAKQVDVFALGLLSVIIAGLAVAISTIFGGALLLTVTKLIGSSPSTLEKAAYKSDRANIFVPGVVASGSLAFLVTIASVIGLIAYLLGWRTGKKQVISRAPGTGNPQDTRQWLRDTPVIQEYLDEKLPAGDATYAKAVKKVAGTWATSRMTDLAAVVGAGLAIPTLGALLAAELANLVDPRWFDQHLLGAAQFGSTLTAAATLGFIGLLRSALLNTASRRRFAVFWDVVNFWPRAAHPFAPPCYAERVVPEVMTRIRRIVGDDKRRGVKDPGFGQVETEEGNGPNPNDQGAVFEPHRPVVLNGYSQGAPISIAVVAQLPEVIHQRLALLTLACPAHRLYGRAFPLYFGPDQLARLLEQKLTGPTGQKRWINMCRRSDYVGGPVGIGPVGIGPVGEGIDEWILDPPALWPDTNPTPVPVHLHSDWFPDPQTHPNVGKLAVMLPRQPDPKATL